MLSFEEKKQEGQTLFIYDFSLKDINDDDIEI